MVAAIVLALLSAVACSPAGGPALDGRIVASIYGELVLVNTGSGSSQPLKPDQTARNDAIDPAWSPNGRELAYIQQAPPQPGDPVPLGRAYLRVFEPASNQDRVVREEPAGALLGTPAWSPDGQQIYYSRVEHRFDGLKYLGFQEMVMRIGRDGGSPEQIILDATMPAASPDGRSLAFVTREPAPRQAGLWRLDLATRETKLLQAAPSPVEVNGPAYAPDGQTIAFSASALGGGGSFETSRAPEEPPVAAAHGLPADIWLLAADGTNPRQVTKLGEDRLLPAWSPDGTKIAALGLGGVFVFGLDGQQIARYEKITGEGSLTWGKTP